MDAWATLLTVAVSSGMIQPGFRPYTMCWGGLVHRRRGDLTPSQTGEGGPWRM
jgi:hypothetical protein